MLFHLRPKGYVKVNKMKSERRVIRTVSGFAALMLHTSRNQNLSGLQCLLFSLTVLDSAGCWVILAGLAWTQLQAAGWLQDCSKVPYSEPTSYGDMLLLMVDERGR